MNIVLTKNSMQPDPGAFPLGKLDDLMADDLKPNDVVMIDEVAHKFLMKVPHGPHLFWNGHEEKQCSFTTTELFKLMDERRYYRPGRDAPTFKSDTHEAEHRQRLEVAYSLFRKEPKRKAEARWLFVAEFLNRIRNAEANGEQYARNEGNARAVIEAVEAEVERHNQQVSAEDKIELPRNRAPRTVLRWVAREFNLQIQEAGLLHGNAITPRARTLPPRVFEIIGEQIREMVEFSYALGPLKIHTRVEDKIKKENAERGTSLPVPSYSTVNNEYRRYDAWVRMAKKEGVAKADLEYGSVGKNPRPKRILDLVEIDHHLFDLHPTPGELGETTLGLKLAQKGLDRFWVCLALDVHSGYPLGFAITFEPGGLTPALMCIDHAIRPKTYVRERWPDINGDLMGFGKPVKVRYDNAKEFVSLQLQQNLARIQVGFELSVPKKPNSKPYVERHFGTIEQDFVHWLKGSTGSGPHDRGDRRPQHEAAVGLDDFNMLFHQYLIEVYARRPQEDLDYETPEQRWFRGANSPSHRPRRLTQHELDRWDLVTTIEVDAVAKDDGVTWRKLKYRSDELQQLRRTGGAHAHRGMKSTPVTLRIPLLDVSKAYVSLRSDELPGGRRFPAAEVLVRAENPHVEGRTIWQHEAVCDFLRRQKLDASNASDYKQGFLRLFENALRAMGAKLDDKKPKVTLTGGQAPRFAGLMMEGPAEPSTAGARKIIERYRRDLLEEHDHAANGPTEIEVAPANPRHQDVLDAEPDEQLLEDHEDWNNAPIEDDE